MSLCFHRGLCRGAKILEWAAILFSRGIFPTQGFPVIPEPLEEHSTAFREESAQMLSGAKTPLPFWAQLL